MSRAEDRDSTGARGLPGAFEGETVDRRRLMAIAHRGGCPGHRHPRGPLAWLRRGPVFAPQGDTWQSIGPLSRFTATDYVPVVFTLDPTIGEAGKSLA